jgi:hypothetical protein
MTSPTVVPISHADLLQRLHASDIPAHILEEIDPGASGPFKVGARVQHARLDIDGTVVGYRHGGRTIIRVIDADYYVEALTADLVAGS